jgi:cysteine desulfurase
MESESVYVDYQAAKPVDPEVIKAMMEYYSNHFGNPSSLHKVGDYGTETLEQSRKIIAEYINADPKEILFTSGATESNNLAILGYAFRNYRKGKHIIISESEHISIFNLTKYLEKNGYKISKVPIDQYGKIKLDKLKSRITDETILISVQTANNEIGTIQPIKEIGDIAHQHNIAFHTDAVAAQGLLDLDVNKLNVDLMSLSSNDFYGPKGVGVLYLRKGFRVQPVLIGGGQERGFRSGSENIAGIYGMAKAVEIMKQKFQDETQKLKIFRDRLIKEVLASVPDSYLNGHPTDRLVNNAHFRFEGIEGESILLSFKDKNISVSTGSACSSKTLEPSHTLIATGLLHEEAHGSLELTTGRFTKESDIDKVIEVLPEIVTKLRQMSPLYDK